MINKILDSIREDPIGFLCEVIGSIFFFVMCVGIYFLFALLG